MNQETKSKNMYHEGDKAGLRKFLLQPSAVKGKKNAEIVGLHRDDIANLKDKDNEEWVEKIKGLVWNDEPEKRLVEIWWTRSYSMDELKIWWAILNMNELEKMFEENRKNIEEDIGTLAGTLDARKWSELTTLNVSGNAITKLNLSNNKLLTSLVCHGNRLIALDVSANTELVELGCWENQLKGLDISANTKLVTLYCLGNPFPLTNLDIRNNIQLQYVDYRDKKSGNNF